MPDLILTEEDIKKLATTGELAVTLKREITIKKAQQSGPTSLLLNEQGLNKLLQDLDPQTIFMKSRQCGSSAAMNLLQDILNLDGVAIVNLGDSRGDKRPAWCYPGAPCSRPIPKDKIECLDCGYCEGNY